MNLLDEHSRRLRDLERSKPSERSWVYVLEMLENKHEGLQAGAIKVLGAWGGVRATETIRAFLGQLFSRSRSRSLRGVAAKALGGLVGVRDVDWVLDLYFSRPSASEQHELFQLVLALPPEQSRSRLVRELSAASWQNRWGAVKAIGNMAFPDRAALLKPLREDVNPEVRASAVLLTR